MTLRPESPDNSSCTSFIGSEKERSRTRERSGHHGDFSTHLMLVVYPVPAVLHFGVYSAYVH